MKNQKDLSPDGEQSSKKDPRPPAETPHGGHSALKAPDHHHPGRQHPPDDHAWKKAAHGIMPKSHSAKVSPAEDATNPTIEVTRPSVTNLDPSAEDPTINPTIEVTRPSVANVVPEPENVVEPPVPVKPAVPHEEPQETHSKASTRVSFADEQDTEQPSAETKKSIIASVDEPEKEDQVEDDELTRFAEPAPVLPGVAIIVVAAVLIVAGLVLVAAKYPTPGFCSAMYGGLLVVFAVFYFVSRCIVRLHNSIDSRARMSSVVRPRASKKMASSPASS